MSYGAIAGGSAPAERRARLELLRSLLTHDLYRVDSRKLAERMLERVDLLSGGVD